MRLDAKGVTWIVTVAIAVTSLSAFGASGASAEAGAPSHCLRVATATAEIGGATESPARGETMGTPVTAASSGSAGVDADETATALEPGDEGVEDYDPWEPFNERTFWFNHDVLDRFVLKPVATGWDKVLPDPAQRSLGRAFDNLDMPRRLVNNLLQGEAWGAGREAARFVLNSTIGVAGFLDVAKALHIAKSDADTGQTLGVYGVGPGPYLVLPFLPPLTVRDAIGYGVDGALDPLSYFLPFVVNRSMSVGRTVNDRSLNLQLFQDVEESVLDLYSAARNAYLQRRRKAVEERLVEERLSERERTESSAQDGP